MPQLPRVQNRVRWLALASLGLGLIPLGASSALAQPSQRTATSTQLIAPLSPPAVFLKSEPETLADVREMETHLTRLVERSQRATVGLRIGRAFGTGVIVTEGGIVLTAGHVIGEPGRRVDVTLWDGSTVRGETLGRNRSFDSGMVQLPKDRKWPHVELAEQTSAGPGAWCAALGHPGGYDSDRGVVLRLGRVISSRRRFIQTDCQLVGGDSGGPLFDMAGRVVAIHSRIGENPNYNFHVPVAVYRDEWDRLASGEDFPGHSGALLGLTGRPDPENRGLLVTEVYRGEPAERAGVLTGDILVLFSSKKVTTLAALVELVGEKRPGEVVTIEVLREGKARRIQVELGMRAE
ncbi:MAG: trypsin-like peptidase domain-containing protein [Planctomyces sp.]|nr:trypsin-like peptidase domain-containing protein [Planctomyces sp.]